MKNLDVLLAAAGGIVVGAAVGILFAPKKGSETREDICKLLKRRHHLCKDKLEELVDKIEAELDAE